MVNKRLLLLLLVIPFVFCSCQVHNHQSKVDTDVIIKKLDELEKKVNVLERERTEVKAYTDSELRALKAELDNHLKDIKDNTNKVTGSNTEEVALSQFKYSIVDGYAIITGYTGKGTHLVIPSRIDGYEVIGIGESAFAYSKLRSVIISEGIKNIGWFAFYTVPTLTTVTIPKSVEYIGYSAFDGSSSVFTVFCEDSSYAFSYAKSYGFSYTIT